MEKIESDVVFQQVIFLWTRQIGVWFYIRKNSLSINCENIPSLCVRTRYKDSTDVFKDNHCQDYNITEFVVLNSIFHNFLCRKLNNNQIILQNNKSTVETIDLLSSDSDDFDSHDHSVKEFDV